jgi:hypothetical protein
MSQVIPGRFTAEIDEPFVVFLIGMRISQLPHPRGDGACN